MGGVWIRLGSNVFRVAFMPPESLSSPAVCVDSAAHGRVGKAADGNRIHISEFTNLNLHPAVSKSIIYQQISGKFTAVLHYTAKKIHIPEFTFLNLFTFPNSGFRKLDSGT